jgi:hypothetical protein
MAGVWWLILMVCVLWYSTVTVYVAIRGAWDIKSMLARLAALNTQPDEDEPADPGGAP